MFPDGQAVPQPQLATVAMGPGQQPQVAAVARGHTTYDPLNYTQDYDYNQYFLQQDEYNMGPTISELPQQDL